MDKTNLATDQVTIINGPDMTLLIAEAHLIIWAGRMQLSPASTVATKATVTRSTDVVFKETHYHSDTSCITMEGST